MGHGVPSFLVLMGWGAPGTSPGVICLVQLSACGGLSNSGVLVDHLGNAGPGLELAPCSSSEGGITLFPLEEFKPLLTEILQAPLQIPYSKLT